MLIFPGLTDFGLRFLLTLISASLVVHTKLTCSGALE